MDALTRNAVRLSGRGDSTLVFGNGFGTDQRAWRLVAPAFAGQRRIVNYDHVGFGASERAAWRPGRHGSLDGHADDLLEILARLDLGAVDYVGHSIAGIIGLLAAIRAPQRFARLVLVGSSPRFVDDPPDYMGGFTRAEVEDILDAMERGQLAWSQSLAPVAMGEQSPADLVREFGNGLSALDPYIARSFGRTVFLVDRRDALPLVRTPALVLQCTHDSIVPRAVGAYLHRHLAGSALRELEATGHCPHLTHPRETTAAIAAYLGIEEATGA